MNPKAPTSLNTQKSQASVPEERLAKTISDKAATVHSSLDAAIVKQATSVWRKDQQAVYVHDAVSRETAVALVYNGISHAVMMASPIELEAFALGFSLSEGIVEKVDDIQDIECSVLENGIEVSITLANRHLARLKQRRRNLAGRTGCGLCGAESLQQVRLAVPEVAAEFSLCHQGLNDAVQALADHQGLQAQTGGFHSAAWCNEQGLIQMLCEDVGRHNALDKLIGRLALNSVSIVNVPGFLLMSSRASYEIIQKAAMAGMAVVVAVSAPTSLAIEIAKETGITLVGFSRKDRHVCYTNAHRLHD